MTYTIRGSHGEVVITDSGEIVSRDGYDDIVRFDVDEYRAWYVARGVESLLDDIGEEDILDLGYWTADTYVPPVLEHREFGGDV